MVGRPAGQLEQLLELLARERLRRERLVGAAGADRGLDVHRASVAEPGALPGSAPAEPPGDAERRQRRAQPDPNRRQRRGGIVAIVGQRDRCHREASAGVRGGLGVGLACGRRCRSGTGGLGLRSRGCRRPLLRSRFGGRRAKAFAGSRTLLTGAIGGVTGRRRLASDGGDREGLPGDGDERLPGDPDRGLVAGARVAEVPVCVPGARSGSRGRWRRPRGSTRAPAPAAIIPCSAQAVDWELIAPDPPTGSPPPQLRPAQVAQPAAQDPVSAHRLQHRAGRVGVARRPRGRPPSRRRRSAPSAARRAIRAGRPGSRRRAGQGSPKAVVVGPALEGAVAAHAAPQLGQQVAPGEVPRLDPGADQGEDRPGQVAGAADLSGVAGAGSRPAWRLRA